MKRLMLFALPALALMLGSCIRDKAAGDDPLTRNGKQLTLSVSITQQTGLQAKTRTPVDPIEGEDDIAALYLLFFQPNGGQFVDYVEVDNVPHDSQQPLDLTAHPMLGVSAAYDILAVGNLGTDRYITGDVDTWMQQWNGKTEAEVATAAMAYVQGGDDDANAIEPANLLMSGSYTKNASDFDIDLTMSRNVVRFDVLNNQKDEYDLASVELWNVYPSSPIWDNNATTDFSSNVARIGRFYGYNNPNPGEDIKGNLYCFENQVIAPTQNDAMTTCLIIGLTDKTTTTTSYYRVNINPKDAPQMITANNVYQVSINNVLTGSASPEDAYGAAESGLDYVINNWDLSDYGVIIQDANSILSIPSKTITFDGNGGTQTFQIFTYNNAGSTSALALGKIDLPNGIEATLNGNTLTVTAGSLGDEKRITGTIELTYAGLKGTVNVVQDANVGAYLRVYLPEDGLKPIAPYADMESGDIRVDASGPWTVELFQPDNGFTFDETGATMITKFSNTEHPEWALGDIFHVYTNSANEESTPRDCFAVVTLDSDPENQAAVVHLSQSAAGVITLDPNVSTLTFNGLGSDLALVAGNATTKTFVVRPSDDGTTIATWAYKWLMPDGETEYTDAPFNIEEHHETAVANAAGNTITISAKGMNTTGKTTNAILQVYVVGQETVVATMNVAQQSLGVNLSPGTMPAVSAAGGTTSPITVVGDASLQFKATLTMDDNVSADGRHLVQYEAKLVNADNGDEIDPSTDYSMDTKLAVKFPKIYYPNRDIPVSATITVTVAGGMSDEMTVTQTALTARPVKAFGVEGQDPYGDIDYTGYDAGYWYGSVGAYGLQDIPGWTWATGNVVNLPSVNSIPDGTTYLQLGVEGPASVNWAPVNDFIDTGEGVTVFSADENVLNAVNSSTSPTMRAGYGPMVYSQMAGGANSVMMNKDEAAANTKIYQYVLDKGKTPLTASQITQGFYVDGYNNGYSLTALASTSAVPLLVNNGYTPFFIDVEHGMIFRGEVQLWNAVNENNQAGRLTFLDNVMCYIGNAAKYGSAFTDLLIEDGPNAQPAPWDSYWGDNAEEHAQIK